MVVFSKLNSSGLSDGVSYCDKCLLTLVEGYGLDLVSRSIIKASKGVSILKSDYAHTKLRSVLERPI